MQLVNAFRARNFGIAILFIAFRTCHRWSRGSVWLDQDSRPVCRGNFGIDLITCETIISQDLFADI
jgi:hypothetical protein